MSAPEKESRNMGRRAVPRSSPTVDKGSMGPRDITVACCVPRQALSLDDKVAWADAALKATPCDLFLLPQEYVGGHYVNTLAQQAGCGAQAPLHVPLPWAVKTFGGLAKRHRTAVGVGACLAGDGDTAQQQSGTEDYLYFDARGAVVGRHRKFALPRYDDYRAAGAGRLRPETMWRERVTPVALPALGLTIGTLFCWELFALTLVPAYALSRTNLLVHPIKFAPRGWLKTKVIRDEQHIVGFGHAPKSQEWLERLRALGRHEALCPIAISCNTWNLGEKFKALTGHVDEVLGTTEILEVGSTAEAEKIHTFTMRPALYGVGLENTFSAGAFKQATGSIDGYGELGPLTMHLKMRRLEAYLLQDVTRLDCLLKDMQMRTKPSTFRRAAAHGLTGGVEQRGFFTPDTPDTEE